MKKRREYLFIYITHYFLNFRAEKKYVLYYGMVGVILNEICIVDTEL